MSIELKLDKVENKINGVEYIILLFISFLVFVNISSLPYYNYFKYFILVVLGVYIILNNKYIFFNKLVCKYYFIIIFYAILNIFISLFADNEISTRNSFLASIVYFGSLLEIVLILLIMVNKGKFLHSFITLKNILNISTFICVLQILFLFTFYSIKNNQILLFGDKFSMSYMILKCICFNWLYFNIINYNNKKLILYLLLFFNIFIAIILQSGTSLLSTFFLLFLLIFDKKIFKFITNPIFIIFFIILSSTFVLWYPNLIKQDVIQYIFTFIGEDINTLSGRTNVFNALPLLIKNKILFGYGYGSSYDILQYYAQTSNAQNGFWELMFNSGIISALIYILIIIKLIVFNKYKSKIISPIYFYIICSIFISFIEVNFNNSIIVISLLGVFFERTLLRGKKI